MEQRTQLGVKGNGDVKDAKLGNGSVKGNTARQCLHD